MVQPVVHDPLFLAVKSDPAGAEDLATAADLADTLRANREACVGMAANMIGRRKCVIAVMNGPILMVMLNPSILRRSGAYEAEEGCLSLPGVRKTTRYDRITVSWQDTGMKRRTADFQGFTAQIIQHEMDHLNGILI